MKRKISLVIGLVLLALIAVFSLPVKAQAASVPYPEEYSAVQVTVPDPILVNKSGNNIVDNNIQLDSDWAAPQYGIDILGQKYFQIASDEYILADDVYPYVATNEIIKVTTDVPAKLYTYDGQLVKNRMLAPNTHWYSDRIMESQTADGNTYFLRVATNEFVKFSDATLVIN
ncbi:hypothetical protein [Companilactobacillus metriopterae]|uniref:hypothetical protein n=1 Tax=Companilactobacillus metriopterae TaxID=1909267 RepID=UPI00100A5562|nr:hypothetical protein [Companilactobacillus metriopterae]